jgi:RsiW-degrading membrane proteinase PrsW (M82 family)
MEYSQSRKSNAWFRVLLAGGLFYLASLIVLIITGNPNLFPTVVLVGNFLVPVAFVAFFYERRHYSLLNMPTTAYTFLYGGLVGVLASSILEPIFVRPMNPTSVLTVGLIEEAAKILGVIIIARRIRPKTEMDGLILGAAAGMGFAALESMGYAFTAFLSSGGSLTAVVYVTMLRGILSPVGHGTWTAILAGMLFRESRQDHFRIDGKVFFTFLGVALLHALWDGLPALIAILFSPGIDVFIAQTIIGGTGFLLLYLRWREARRLQLARLLQPEPLTFDAQKPVDEKR